MYRLVCAQKKRNAEIFESAMGYKLSYKNPRSFNEKLNWLKFYYRDPLMTQCSGKDTVRDYVRDVLGDESAKYLTKLVGKGVYRSVDEIDFNDLPNQFALKLNSGSGTNIVCSNKDSLNEVDAKARMASWLQLGNNYYNHKFEWGYKDVEPAIVCEEFLGDMGTIRDYKIFCFNGEPRFIYVSNEYDEFKQHITMDYLTLDWKKTSYVRKKYKPPEQAFEKPPFLNEIISVARKLSEPFPFVRVDFVGVDGQPKVIEMTFYPSGGTGSFEDVAHDYEIGDMLIMPRPKNPAYLIERIDTL